MAEQELRAANKDSSWRDKLRDEMLLKYGRTGKNIAEGLVGESEENKYLNFLLKKYGTYDLSKLPPEVRENIPMNRPLGEMKNIGSGGGISDIGAADALLMGMSPYSWPAALTESGVLGADAKGEYDKGNTAGAAIMGTIAGVPPLVRYGFGPKTASKTTETTEPAVDEGRRSVLKGIGALGAMSTGVGKILGEGGGTAASVAGKVAKAMPKVAPMPFIDAAFNVLSDSAKKITGGMNLGKGSKFDDLELLNIRGRTDMDVVVSNYDYPLSNIFSTANKAENTSGKQVSRAEFDKIIEEEFTTGRYAEVDKGWKFEADYKKIAQSDEFKEQAYKHYTEVSNALRKTDAGKTLVDTQRMLNRAQSAEQEAREFLSKKLFNKPFRQLHRDEFVILQNSSERIPVEILDKHAGPEGFATWAGEGPRTYKELQETVSEMGKYIEEDQKMLRGLGDIGKDLKDQNEWHQYY